MVTLREIRLWRCEAGLCELHRALPKGARVLRVRYTDYELVCLYRL